MKKNQGSEAREGDKTALTVVIVFLLLLAFFFLCPAMRVSAQEDALTWSFETGPQGVYIALCGFIPGTVQVQFNDLNMTMEADEAGCVNWPASSFKPGFYQIRIEDEAWILPFVLHVHESGQFGMEGINPQRKGQDKDFSAAKNGDGGINFYRYCQLLNGGQVGFIRSQADSWDCDDVLLDLNQVCRDIYGQGYQANIGNPRDAYTVSCQRQNIPQPQAIQFVEDDGTCAGLESFQRIGALALVNDADDQPMNVRDSWSRTANLVAQFQPKTQLLIKEGPYCAQEAIWWGAHRMDQLNADLVYFAEVTRLGYNVKPWSLTEPFYGAESFTNICTRFTEVVEKQTALPTVGFVTRPSCDAGVTQVKGGLSNIRLEGNITAEIIAKTPQGALLPVRGAQWDGSRWWLEVFWGNGEDQKGFVSCGSEQDLLSHCPANPPK